MVRPRSIDREKLLDFAEHIVARDGAAALSFGALADAASLSKASVQTAFGSREALIEALLSRSMKREAEHYQTFLGTDVRPISRLKAHLRATQTENESAGRTVSALLAILASTGNASTVMKDWYRVRLNDLEADDLSSRKQRVAYLAAEGAFLLRNLVGMEIDDDKWASIFRDIESAVD
ncbi:TetR family transcriptional regulator [Rhizobiales bacterium RZME27]|uniref:TetR family transcriptional regulator n=1 Tax=Endobacterium cereale TaxID=2663029 RepID=A0A6A8AA41_9HYPH|nr:TetR/AcrR family transcriptional regulator [Endobacterium cereale]MEB2847002.1 TetR/AcrR family transcriptional regulator [Endobacterium cereale]MQY47579.1 TetR family transcriptional regulator [Endobacterium cereale]